MLILLTNDQQTVQVDKEALATLTQESLEKSAGIQRLEEAATELYKALQAGQDTGSYPSFDILAILADCFFRHGCNNGTIAGVSDPQRSILQANIRLPFHHVHSPSA
jgi:hypothetical protein